LLDASVEIRNVSQGIELLLKTIYDLNANVDNDTVCYDRLKSLKDTLDKIENDGTNTELRVK